MGFVRDPRGGIATAALAALTGAMFARGAPLEQPEMNERVGRDNLCTEHRFAYLLSGWLRAPTLPVMA
ncbi:hypothetical protein SUDANB1_01541 [Streptomyces sp. enrichment culture]